MVTITCPNCQKSLKGKDDLAGRVVVCPACKAEFTIPLPAIPVNQPESESDPLDFLNETESPPVVATVAQKTLHEPRMAKVDSRQYTRETPAQIIARFFGIIAIWTVAEIIAMLFSAIASRFFYDWIGSVFWAITALSVIPLFLLITGLPTIIAYERNHPNLVPIFILNLFFGWTLIGWVGALIWALIALPERAKI